MGQRIKKRLHRKRRRQYYCDYCDRYMSPDPMLRARHNQNLNHMRNVDACHQGLSQRLPQLVDACQAAVRQSYLNGVQYETVRRMEQEGSETELRSELCPQLLCGGFIVVGGSLQQHAKIRTPEHSVQKVTVGGVNVSAMFKPLGEHMTIKVGGVPIATSKGALIPPPLTPHEGI